MTLSAEFCLTVPLSCSLGIFAEVECRVEVEYDTDGTSVDGWTVIGVQPDGLKGWIRKSSPDFAMFEAGVKLAEAQSYKLHGRGDVTAECLSAAEDEREMEDA